MGLLLGGGGRATSIKNTVSDLCQPDGHFLAFSDTTRNEHPASLTIELGLLRAYLLVPAQPDLFLADVFVYRLVGRSLLDYPVEVRHSPSREYKETPTKQAPLHARPCGVCETYSLPLCYVNFVNN